MTRALALLMFFSLQSHAAILESPFKVSTLNTKWYESPLPSESSDMMALYRAPEIRDGVQATLSIRLDSSIATGDRKQANLDPRATRSFVNTPTANLNLTRYSQQWLNDFARFGFEVLKTETRRLNGDTAIVADVEDLHHFRRQRQMIRTNGRHVAILTCTDSPKNFFDSAKACEVMMNTFRWMNSSARIEGLHHSPLAE